MDSLSRTGEVPSAMSWSTTRNVGMARLSTGYIKSLL